MYIYTPGGKVNKVFASDAGFEDNFGTTVSTTNNFSVGSAPFVADNTGEPFESAMVFVRLADRLNETVSVTGVDGSVVLRSEQTRRQ